MKNFTPKKVICVILVFCTASIAQHENAGTTAANFLKIAVGARSVALGGAFSAFDNDPMSTYWNPAGIGTIKDSKIGIMHNQWIHDSFYEYFSFVSNYNSVKYGISLAYFSAGKIDRTIRVAPGEFNRDGSFTPFDFAISVSFAKMLNQHFSVGGSLKTIYQSIDTYSGKSVAVDAGMQYFRENWTLAAVMRNLGTPLSVKSEKFPLPLAFAAAAKYQFHSGILTTAEIEKPVDNVLQVKFGLELNFKNILFLRSGYSFSNYQNELAGLAGFSAGFGFAFSAINMDYAFSPMGILGSGHRVSFVYDFYRQKNPELATFNDPVAINPGEKSLIAIQLQNCEKPENWQVQILSSKQEIVYQWDGEGQPPQKISWDGKNADNLNCNDGTYTYRVEVVASDEKILKSDGKIVLLPRQKQDLKKVFISKVFVLDDVLFDSDRAVLKPDALVKLDQVSDFIRNVQNPEILIAGHTDSKAGSEYNMSLSQARANSVLSYLAREKGINLKQMFAIGFGETNPVAPNDSPENRQLNRRVEITVSYEEMESDKNRIPDFDEYLQQAKDFIDNKKYSEAINILNPLKNKTLGQEQFESYLYYSGTARFETGDLKQAFSTLKQLVKTFPESKYKSESLRMIGEISIREDIQTITETESNQINDNTDWKEIGQIIERVKYTAIKFDIVANARGTEFKRIAQQDADNLFNETRQQASNAGYKLILLKTTTENAVWELLEKHRQLIDGVSWRRLYTAKNGKIVEAKDLQEGQVVLVLYK